MSKTVVITKSTQFNKEFLVQYEDGKPCEISVVKSLEESILGNIYIGKVKNIVKNIEAAFVEVERDLICYYEPEKNENPVYVFRQSPKKLCEGDEILVQVAKEAHKTKQPFVTSNLNFTGKYVVLTSGNTSMSVSSKLSAEDKARFKSLSAPLENDDYGLIFRTNASGVADDVIMDEIHHLQEEFETVKRNCAHKRAFSLIKAGMPDYISTLLGLYDDDNVEKIITDNANIFEKLNEFAKEVRPEFAKKLAFHDDKAITLNALYGVDHDIKEATNTKVWLKSGGYLVIEPTEAMTVIDVNSGKAVSKKKQKETFLKINMEAAAEIAKQLRLRNISGIIIVDFIDLETEEEKKTLMDAMKGLVKADPIKTTVVDMTRLNLMEITRKRIKQSLTEQLVDN